MDKPIDVGRLRALSQTKLSDTRNQQPLNKDGKEVNFHEMLSGLVDDMKQAEEGNPKVGNAASRDEQLFAKLQEDRQRKSVENGGKMGVDGFDVYDIDRLF
jgi:hypothetical protein